MAIGSIQAQHVDVGEAVQNPLAGQPQAIVQIGAYTSCAAFMRATRKAGFSACSTTCPSSAQALATELGEARGVMVSR